MFTACKSKRREKKTETFQNQTRFFRYVSDCQRSGTIHLTAKYQSETRDANLPIMNLGSLGKSQTFSKILLLLNPRECWAFKFGALMQCKNDQLCFISGLFFFLIQISFLQCSLKYMYQAIVFKVTVVM